LHTNDSISTAMRLIDMGCDAYLVASSLRAVIAQRLIRKVCEYCSEADQLSSQERAWIRNISPAHVNTPFVKGRGCHQCNNTGYSGRIGVYELLEMDDAMLDGLRRNSAAEFANAANANPHYVSLTDCAMRYAEQGITSVHEVFRISASLDERASNIPDDEDRLEKQEHEAPSPEEPVKTDDSGGEISMDLDLPDLGDL